MDRDAVWDVFLVIQIVIVFNPVNQELTETKAIMEQVDQQGHQER
jgi:hypothetical protein